MALLDHQGRIDEIRFLLGDVNTSILPDSTIDRFVTMEEEDYDTGLDNQCYVIYNALMKCLLWLVNKSVASTGGASGGAITKVKEEMGSIKKEIQYSASSESTSSSTWGDLYDIYKKNPELVCKALKRKLGNLIKVGGVSRSEKQEIYSDSDLFGAGYAENQDARDTNLQDYLDQQSDPYYFPPTKDNDF